MTKEEWRSVAIFAWALLLLMAVIVLDIPSQADAGYGREWECSKPVVVMTEGAWTGVDRTVGGRMCKAVAND